MYLIQITCACVVFYRNKLQMEYCFYLNYVDRCNGMYIRYYTENFAAMKAHFISA